MAPGDGSRGGGPPGSTEAVEGPATLDQAPHQVENRGWRRRRAVDPSDRAMAEAAAPAIAAALDELRRVGRYAPDDVAAALAGIGHAPDRTTVRPMERSAGAVYGVRVGGTACIHGDVRPERALVEVAGLHLEGCAEPPVGH